MMAFQANPTTSEEVEDENGRQALQEEPMEDEPHDHYTRMERNPRAGSFQIDQQQLPAGRYGRRWSDASSAMRTPRRRNSMFANGAGGIESTRGHPDAGYGILDQTESAESFFSSVRAPASFLVGTSFTQIFALDDEHNNSSIQNQLQVGCLACQGLTFVLSMNVLVLSTSALVRILTGDFDAYSANAYEMLFREFHYEFVSVRWSFNVSMYGFLLAVMLKVLYQFELFNVYDDDYVHERLELGIAVVLLMFAFYLHLTAYVNQTLIGWSNQYTMTLDLIKMLLQQGKHTIREPLSMILTTLGIVFLAMAFVPGAQLYTGVSSYDQYQTTDAPQQ